MSQYASDPTPYPTYEKLYEEGDYFITPNKVYSIGLTRESVIIHVCPDRDDNRFHHMIITMPDGMSGPCYYCNQTVPEAMQTLYKLQNFDHFAGDNHAPSWLKHNPHTKAKIINNNV